MLTRAVVLISSLTLLLSYTNAAHKYYWRDYVGSIPDDALGTDGLYVAQVVTKGLLPATFYPNTNEAVTEQETRRVIFKNGIKLLCDAHASANFVWEFVNINNLTGEKLKELVIGGLELDTTLYIGKIFHEGQWKIGKVFPPFHEYRGLRVWNQHGDVYAVDDFQVLKYIDN